MRAPDALGASGSPLGQEPRQAGSAGLAARWRRLADRVLVLTLTHAGGRTQQISAPAQTG